MWNWISKLAELTQKGESLVLVTVSHVLGSTPREPGAKLIVCEDGSFHGTVGGGQLEQRVLDDARETLTTGHARTVRYPLGAKAGQCCGGVMDVLFEPLNVGPRLYLFGGGHVAQALCQVLEGTPFQIDLIDEREEWREAKALPAHLRRHESWEDFLADAPFDQKRTFAAVMTHRHDLDQELIAALLKKPLLFLGLIGSKPKWTRFTERLRQAGHTDEELARVHCPIGLPVGGKAPREVAISVAAQLLQVHHTSSGQAQSPADRVGAPLSTNTLRFCLNDQWPS